MNWNNSKIETSLANAVTEIIPDLSFFKIFRYHLYFFFFI